MNQFTKQLAILFIALTSLQSCDVEKFIDTNIKEKSLVVIAPDFIQNRVAIVFEDADTGALIEEDLEVRLIASEMLIDLAGNYKNDFTAKKGLLNFAVDPNANNSEPVTLNIDAIYNKTGDKMATYQETFKLDNSSKSTVLRIPLSIQNSVNQGVSKSEIFNDKSNSLLFLAINGVKYAYEFEKILNYIGNLSYNVEDLEGEDFNFDINAYDAYNWRNIYGHIVFSSYYQDGIKKKFQIKENGEYKRFIISERNGTLIETLIESDRYLNYNNSFRLDNIDYFTKIKFRYVPEKNLSDCSNGFSLVFEGLNDGEQPTFLYKTVSYLEDENRVNPETFISQTGYASPTVKNPTHNTVKNVESHVYSLYFNKIVFEENSQYIIEPQKMDLGGIHSCGKTFNFKVYPKDGHDRYTLNLQFQCEGEEFSTAPSLTAFLKEEESSTSKSIIRLENGSTSLVLKPEAAYSVQGSFNETEFGFTFTANESQIEQAIAKTIAENNNIKDIEYTISKINNVESVINAKIIFKEGACPE